MDSWILYQNRDKTVTLLDIPRSIELAQEFDAEDDSRLISCKPLEKPYPSTEPKSAKALAALEAPSIQDLILQRHIQFALDEIRSVSGLTWCLPRVGIEGEPSSSKRKPDDDFLTETDVSAAPLKKPQIVSTAMGISQAADLSFFQNSTPVTQTLGGSSESSIFIPPHSSFLCGDINTTLPLFTTHAPKFNLIILDPPWPNRSARRSHSYSISQSTHEISLLLTSIPLQIHLAENALVGVWITNKEAFRNLVLADGGVFDQWGVRLLEEWVWLKVTREGEPICPIEGRWRKPYEILLVGRKFAAAEQVEEGVKRRVIVGVPDLHSRKPNLKVLFEDMLPNGYEALEIFARNLTAAWWAWGNEVLKFQHGEQWIPVANVHKKP